VKFKTKKPHSAVSPARAAAFDILIRAQRESSYASELLHSKTYDGLSLVDHSLTTELVMGVLRWRSVLDSQIAESSAQPISKLDLEVLTTLRLALYQLRWLDRIPPRAAINESVELVKRARKRSAAPFVNAVLRKIEARISKGLSEARIKAESAEDVAVKNAHPKWLVERWTQQYGLDLARTICEYDQSVPATTIRLRHPEAVKQLEADGIKLAPGTLLSSARRVLHGDVTKSEAFRAGLCVIQDEASQLVAALIGAGRNILDCCAAPGGKTAAISDRNSAATISAVELHPHRARLLRKLLNAHPLATAASTRPIQVIAADARKLPFAQTFDRILADVPCSGTGTLARNPEIKWRLTPEDLADLQQRQVAILDSAMAQLGSGGRLIYSTCSLEIEENEDVIDRSIANRSLTKSQTFRIVDCREQLDQLQRDGELIYGDIPSLTRGPFLRTLPGVLPCDGFFAAILEKT
jgi:16S rRNA (cytosine967-C5)-methyltransferase